MVELLTYTYGAKNVKTLSSGNVNADLYKQSRGKSSEKGKTVVDHEVAAMKSLMGVDVAPNEQFFEGKNHVQTSAKDVFKGQHISMSVVATPAALDKAHQAGTDRVDHYNAAIEISDKVTDITNDGLKKALLNAYSSRVDSEVARINGDLGTKITKEDYAAMLLGTKKPSDVIPGLSFKETPRFFEARAMANHNICNNLTYGLAFPNFKLETKGETISTQPTTETTITAGSLAEQMTVKETAIDVGLNLNKKTPDKPGKPNEPDKTTTTPGHDKIDYATNPNAGNNVINTGNTGTTITGKVEEIAGGSVPAPNVGR